MNGNVKLHTEWIAWIVWSYSSTGVGGINVEFRYWILCHACYKFNLIITGSELFEVQTEIDDVVVSFCLQ